MSKFTFSLFCFLALHFLLSYLPRSSAFQSDETPAESDHYHIVDASSLQTASTCSPSANVSSQEEFLKLVHSYGPCSPSRHGKANAPFVQESLKQDQKRLIFKASRLYGKNQIRVNTYEGGYVVNVGLGMPKRELTLLMDTGSSLLWTQCQPCKLGKLSGCSKQRHPIFDPSKSSTYTNIRCPSPTCSLGNTTLGLTTCVSSTCKYDTSYVDGSEDIGFLAKERVSVGSNTFKDIIFGCTRVKINDNLDVDGILGLSTDFLSFVEQTTKTYQRVFSYCIPSKQSEIGFLRFGKAKQVSKSLKFTQLGADYAIQLSGIKLGNTILPITFKKGTVSIDSGSTYTGLPSEDYITLRNAYRKAMSHYKLAKPYDDTLDTCYHVDGHHKLKFPTMSFLFADGLVLHLPPSGVALYVNSTLVCFPFTTVPGDLDMVLFGNTQQKTLEIVYDVAGGKLGFGYGGCK